MTIFSSFPSTLNLNADQRAAVYAIQEFLDATDCQVFILRGYAGTGKTTLMEGVIRYLSNEGCNVMAMAPTGRAARILSTKTGEKARTIHSVVYKQSNIELSGDSMRRRFVINSTSPSDGTVLIADEASMLSDYNDGLEEATFGTGRTLSDMLTFIDFKANPNTKLIFIGDDAQLLPVKSPISPALDARYLQSNFGLKVREITLSEVMRHNNSILDVATKVRQDLASGNFYSVCPAPQGEVKVVLHGELVDTFLSENPNVTEAHDSVMIVGSNEKAFEYNMTVRNRFFPLGDGTPMVGDRLMVCANIYGTHLNLINGEIIEICAVGEAVTRRHTLKCSPAEWNAFQAAKIKPAELEFEGFDKVKVTLRFRKMQVRVHNGTRVDIIVLNDFLFSADTELNSMVRRAMVVDLRERISNTIPGKEKSAVDAAFLDAVSKDAYFNAVPVKFAYAITCHKAQGGEWKHVYANICTRPDDSKTAGFFRWAYTAMTRASQTLTLGSGFIPRATSAPGNFSYVRRW
ncbi:MAG: ATP-dependent DNA helicase [Saprospiraceae bacterium]